MLLLERSQKLLDQMENILKIVFFYSKKRNHSRNSHTFTFICIRYNLLVHVFSFPLLVHLISFYKLKG